MKGKRRRALATKRATRRGEAYLIGGKRSRYARKFEWLRTHGHEWGFNVPYPKPWR